MQGLERETVQGLASRVLKGRLIKKPAGLQLYTLAWPQVEGVCPRTILYV